jgi:hypothetical protein
MRSPLDLIRGEFDHALFTTYTIALPFFERWVLPALAGAGVRSVVVFADDEMLGMALADPHVQLAGRAYHVHGINAKGVFHPKLILLSSAKRVRLCVSSANLTVSGQLRNLESAAVFDSGIPGHTPVIGEAIRYLRRLSEEVPVHLAEAVFDAISSFELTDEERAVAQFMHNLDTSIIENMPEDVEAIAAFADSTGFSRLKPSRFVVDGSIFAASRDFFDVDRKIEARSFERQLHGKAYWRADGSWTMVGSPNVTEPGLLRPAASGNYEIAVVFDQLEKPFDLPDSIPWGGEPIADAAPRRRLHRRTKVAEADQERFGSFSSWEEEGAVAVEGLPEGTEVLYSDGLSFERLAAVVNGRLTVPTEVRPHLLRCEVGGVTLLSVVHRVTELRARRNRSRITARSRPLSGRLPLDPAAQKVVEQVIGEFFALAALVGEERGRRSAGQTRGGSQEPEADEAITEWIPADHSEEPRIPDLYRQVWAERDSTDVLLALVRVALRLEEPDEIPMNSGLDESAMAEEELGIDDLGGDPDLELEVEEDALAEPTMTTRQVLDRYRGAFMRRLGEVVNFVRKADDQGLRDLAFQVALTQQERLTIEVEVDGEMVPLIDPEALLRQRLQILEAYLRRPSTDLRCLETARFHLASCLRERSMWTPREWERLETISYLHGRRVIESELPLQPVGSLFGMDADIAAAWIEELAARTDWSAIADHAGELIDDVQLESDPYPFLLGAASFSEISHAPGREGSPAWDVVGFGAVAGLADEAPFGVGVDNTGGAGNFDKHVVVVVPTEKRLFEMVRRRTDRRWLIRSYTPIGKRELEEAGRLGPTVLSETFRTPWEETEVAALPAACGPTVEALLATVPTSRPP